MAAALVIAGCASSAPSPRPITPTVAPSSAASAAAPSPVEQTLTMALDEDPTGRLSNVATGASTRKAAAFLYNGLYGLDEPWTRSPCSRTGPPAISADGLTWTVNAPGRRPVP